MTLFSLMISFVNRELVFAVDSIRQPWLNFQRWFLVLLWLIVCLTIPCVKHESIFAIGFMRRSWILWSCRLHTSAVTHTWVAISRSIVTLFSLMISGRLCHSFHWRFHASTTTLFSLLISLVNRELVFAVDSTLQPWLNFQRWFLVLQWLSFRWRFMDQHWHSVFDDSMPQTWI